MRQWKWAFVAVAMLLLALGIGGLAWQLPSGGQGPHAQSAATSLSAKKITTSLTIPTSYGFSYACVNLTGNPTGQYSTITTYQGYDYYNSSGVLVTSEFADARGHGHSGPAVVTNKFSYPQCGIIEPH